MNLLLHYMDQGQMDKQDPVKTAIGLTKKGWVCGWHVRS